MIRVGGRRVRGGGRKIRGGGPRTRGEVMGQAWALQKAGLRVIGSENGIVGVGVLGSYKRDKSTWV